MGALVALAALGIACHQNNPELHLSTMHGGFFDLLPPGERNELWCLDMTSSQGLNGPVPPSTLDGLTVGAKIAATLDTDSPIEKWESIGGIGRINFILKGGCDDLSGTTNPPISDVAIQFHVTANGSRSPCNVDWEVTPPQPGLDNVSCVYHDVPFTWETGHVDRRYAFVFFDDGNIDGAASEYHHTINHEVGHVLGLSDPNLPRGCRPACGTLSNPFLLETCIYVDLSGHRLWVDSIMHSEYYCSGETVDAPPYPEDREWPSGRDRFIVEGIVNSVP